MKIKGVVFDLDHTLFDRYATIEAIAPAFKEMFADYIADGITSRRIAELICEGDRRYIYYGWQRVLEHLCESGMFARKPEYEQYRNGLLKLFTTKAIPYPFTYSVLADVKARGLKTGLITNGKAAIQREKLKLLNLTDSFDAIVLCGEFGVQKPDPAPFKEMARLLDTSTDALIYVGDNPVCDVGGARGAGYTTVQVLTASCSPDGAPVGDYRIGSVAELGALLDRIG